MKVLAMRLDVGTEVQGSGTGDGPDAFLGMTDPGDDSTVVKADAQFHPHAHLPPLPLHQPDHICRLGPWWHAIDQLDFPCVRDKVGFEDQGAVTVTATPLSDTPCWHDAPAAVILCAQQSRKARGGIKPRETEPIDGPVPCDQRRGFAVPDEGIVLNLRRQLFLSLVHHAIKKGWKWILAVLSMRAWRFLLCRMGLQAKNLLITLPYSYNGRSVMQAERQLQVLPVVLKASGRKRRRAEQGFYVI